MKKRNWICLVLIVLCIAVLIGYRTLDQIRTDSEKTKITVNSDIPEVSVQDPDSALLQGVSAWDDTDGDVTASLVVESVQMVNSDGTVQVSIAAFDKAGNVAKTDRQVRYTDYESPRFSLSAPLAFSQSSGTDIFDVVDASDSLDGDIGHRIRATSLSDQSISSIGIHDVEFRVTNSLGDTVRLTLPVEVYATGSYEAGLTLTDYLVYLNVGDSFNPKSYLGSYTRNLESVSLRSGMPEGYSLRTIGEVDTQTPGVYSVAYKVTYTIENERDPENSLKYTGYSKLIVVVEG